MNWTHGTNGLLIGYALSAVGVLVGLLVGRAPLQRTLAFPLIAIPVFIVGVLLLDSDGRPPKGNGHRQ